MCLDEPGYVRLEEVCDAQVFEGQCYSDDEVLLVHSALYGRMALGNCVQKALGYEGCAVDVLAEVDNVCSGRSACAIPVNRANNDLIARSHCERELVSYLELQYECVKGKHYRSTDTLKTIIRLEYHHGKDPTSYLTFNKSTVF